ncbi:MAG: T9SS type A sorting domain-containing protein [Saprospiraceae bacterium]|nr:T9SS type A sorting domain-containing protein [Saprospiraceae bacterium]
MKKFIFTSTFIFLFSSFCFSQNYYSKVYNFLNGNEYGTKLRIRKDTVFIMAIGICDPGTDQSRSCHYLISVTEDKVKTYMFDNRLKIAPANGSFIQNDTIFIFGIDYRDHPATNKIVVMKTNFNADSLGQLTYLIKENTYTSSESILVKGDYIFLNGNIDNEKGDRSLYVLKMDKSGKVLRDERFPDFVHPPKYKLENMSRNLVETTDGNLAILSFYYKDDMNFVGVCKFDDDFFTIWQMYLPVFGSAGLLQNPWPFMTATMDNGLVVSKEINLRDSLYWPAPNPDKYKGKEETAVTLTKLDIDGNMAWSDTLFTNVYEGKSFGPYKTIKKLYTCNNGDILCIGDLNCRICDLDNQAWLARYSNDGKMKWEHVYSFPDIAPSGSGTFFMDAKEAENGDIICTGSIDDVNAWHNDKQYTWLLRLDSIGCYDPGCTLSATLDEIIITANEEIIINVSGKVVVYPNPAQEVINISVPEGFNAEEIEVLDILGQRIMDLGQEYEEIDISHMEPGLYFIVMKNKDGRMMSSKFVKGR